MTGYFEIEAVFCRLSLGFHPHNYDYYCYYHHFLRDNAVSLTAAPLGTTVCVQLVGSDPVSLASGFHHYLKYVANCSVSWLGNQLANLPTTGPVPTPALPIRETTTYQYRYYMNVCTFGYSTVGWFARVHCSAFK